MTPPHITDSDLVHVMDLVWTSHTDKQQPHRQHLSWKRNAVACFGCCFTAYLTSTYMFRAIFDCYGNMFFFFKNGTMKLTKTISMNTHPSFFLMDQWTGEFPYRFCPGFRRLSFCTATPWIDVNGFIL